jgi:hypothetical protein
MKPSEYIDKTLSEAAPRMPSTPEERNAYQKGMISRMAQIERQLKIHADNPIHVKQLKYEWDRLNGLYLASFDRSEPKNEDNKSEGTPRQKELAGQLKELLTDTITKLKEVPLKISSIKPSDTNEGDVNAKLKYVHDRGGFNSSTLLINTSISSSSETGKLFGFRGFIHGEAPANPYFDVSGRLPSADEFANWIRKSAVYKDMIKYMKVK